MFELDDVTSIESSVVNLEKDKRNKRFMQKRRHIDRQLKLRKQYMDHQDREMIDLEPHRYHKVKSLNCGDPNCIMCGNPRKFWNDVTIQEKSFNEMADIETEELIYG